ncbi:MAG: DUF2062 domain-containing protein [Phycisphaerales bacterium]|nr:DUF2062 domain-containing protein [Phycisphaerales bacterium]
MAGPAESEPLPDDGTASGAEFSACVVVPVFNHAGSVGAVLDGIGRLGLPVVVVDDGSSDGSGDAAAAWAAAHPGARLVVERHAANRGKAAALATGFARAGSLGVTHAVTIDADGQLDPVDIPRLVDAAVAGPRALVLGDRPRAIAECPSRCRLGRRLACLALRAQTGLRLHDTQCGLRVYPLELVRAVRCRGGRYTFEAEVVTRAWWAGFPVVSVPVTCRYFPEGERVSHFRPVRDSTLHTVMQLRLIGRSLLPWPTRRRERPARLVDVLGWLNPLRAWREARAGDLGRLEMAASLGIGVWIGSLPWFGFHTALVLYLAWRLHFHPAPMLLGSQVSMPPIGLALVAASVGVGYLLLFGHWPDLAEFDPRAVTLSVAGELVAAWTVGGVLVGFALGVVVFTLTMVLWRRRA